MVIENLPLGRPEGFAQKLTEKYLFFRKPLSFTCWARSGATDPHYPPPPHHPNATADPYTHPPYATADSDSPHQLLRMTSDTPRSRILSTGLAHRVHLRLPHPHQHRLTHTRHLGSEKLPRPTINTVLTRIRHRDIGMKIPHLRIRITRRRLLHPRRGGSGGTTTAAASGCTSLMGFSAPAHLHTHTDTPPEPPES